MDTTVSLTHDPADEDVLRMRVSSEPVVRMLDTAAGRVGLAADGTPVLFEYPDASPRLVIDLVEPEPELEAA